MYCTGGIRCEKVAAYIIQNLGYTNVYRLEGGINNYLEEFKDESLFIGKNFVFDNRLIKSIASDNALSFCISCDTPTDNYVNCINPICNKLFIQCSSCSESSSTCSDECNEFMKLPQDKREKIIKEENKIIRQNRTLKDKSIFGKKLSLKRSYHTSVCYNDNRNHKLVDQKIEEYSLSMTSTPSDYIKNVYEKI